MYFCDEGIVLRHRDTNEYDRIVSIFSRNYGRLEVNFKSVRKSNAKLRGLTELFVYCDFRLYLRKYGAIPLCIGGSIISSYPQIRNDFEKLFLLSFISDVTISLTPVYQKSIDKFNLLLSSLNYFSSAKRISHWFIPIFILNMLEYYGSGFKNTNVGYDLKLWNLMHNIDFDMIDKLNEYDELYTDVIRFVFDELNRVSEKNFRMDNLAKFLIESRKRREYVFSGYNK